MRTSAATAPFSVAKTGLRSISAISGKSLTSSRDLHDQVGERVARHGLAAAHALQHLCRLDAVEHGERILLRRGGEAEGDVLQHLDQHAAEAERHQLAKARVGHGADDHLLPAGEHLLHLHAVDLGVRLVAPGVGEDRVVALGDVLGALQVRRARRRLRSCGGCPARRSSGRRESPCPRRALRPRRPSLRRLPAARECRRRRRPACPPARSARCACRPSPGRAPGGQPPRSHARCAPLLLPLMSSRILLRAADRIASRPTRLLRAASPRSRRTFRSRRSADRRISARRARSPRCARREAGSAEPRSGFRRV